MSGKFFGCHCRTFYYHLKSFRFREMYRLPRCLALDFLDLINTRMGGDPCPDVPKTVQFCSVLNFYASGSYQRRVGADALAMISQSLVSRCVRAYSYTIATKLVDQFIQFPTTIAEIETLHDTMQTHTDFPGAFAIVDGSLIAVASVPNEVDHVMMSRKQFHAINTQFVIDASMRFLSVNARYGGSTHDALIWRSSLVNTWLRRLSSQMGSSWSYYMLGDNGYPLQPWLLKPYDNPNTNAQRLYNRNHRKLRSLVERAIGLLKARFRCVLGERKLRYDHQMSGYIIYSCAVLHNYLIVNDYPIGNIDPIIQASEFDEEAEDYDVSMDDLQGGVDMRNEMADYFMNS